jgi:hypothetical protein
MVTFVMVLGAATAPAQSVAPLATVRAAEAAVQAMPLEDRPNRLGHFYGNSVRRAQQGRLCVNCGQYERPLARYLYLSR